MRRTRAFMLSKASHSSGGGWSQSWRRSWLSLVGAVGVSGFRSLGFRVWEFRVQGLGPRVSHISGFGSGIYGLEASGCF